MSADLSLLLGGTTWAQSLGYGQVSVEELAYNWSGTGGGLQYVKFHMALPPGFYHPLLTQDTTVDVYRGPVRLGTATLSDIDRGGWEFVADGLYRRAENINAEDSTGAPSTNLRNIVTQGNARGLGWSGFGNLATLSLSSMSEANAQLNTIADVLNAYCALNGKRWGVDPTTNVPYIGTDPVDPTLALRPGTPEMPTADDDYISRVTVRYMDSTTTYATVAASTSSPIPRGIRETSEDITSLGVITTPAAQAYADAIIANTSARLAFTAGLEVGRGQLTNTGNVDIDPWAFGLLVCGQRTLHYGILASDGATAYGQTLDWVIGNTVYKPTDGTVTITPTNLAARTVATIGAQPVNTPPEGLS